MQYFFEQGAVSEFELNLKKHNRKSSEEYKVIENELQYLEWGLQNEYNIPQNMFEIIDSDIIKSCKKNDISFLIKKENMVELEEANINFDLEKAANYPSVSLSLGLTPKMEGLLGIYQ